MKGPIFIKPITAPTIGKSVLAKLLVMSNFYFPEFRGEIHEFYDDEGRLEIGCNNIVNIGCPAVPKIQAWTLPWVEWFVILADKAGEPSPFHLYFWQNNNPTLELWDNLVDHIGNVDTEYYSPFDTADKKRFKELKKKFDI